jgi:hypothetical protein
MQHSDDTQHRYTAMSRLDATGLGMTVPIYGDALNSHQESAIKNGHTQHSSAAWLGHCSAR